MTDTVKNYKNIAETINPEGVEKFLASSWVDGIGPAYAKRLTDKFGIDAAIVLKESPEEALCVPGLGQARVESASESLNKLKWSLELLIFLYSCGISDVYISRIFGKYRKRTENIIREDPYSMVEDVWQLSFFTADKIGKNLGIAENDSRRLQGALVTAVKHFAEQGHLFADPDQALEYASHITDVEKEIIEKEIPKICEAGRIVISRGGLYLPVFYNAEREGADKLMSLKVEDESGESDVEIPKYSKNGHPYSHRQKEAIKMGVRSPVMVLTGGPGSGKTTVLRGMIDIFEKGGKKVILAAPTGRAAKRMTALTGVEASTIHRLLGYRQGEGYFAGKIDADVLIIDEGSMMEQVLFNHLLSAGGQGL